MVSQSSRIPRVATKAVVVATLIDVDNGKFGKLGLSACGIQISQIESGHIANSLSMREEVCCESPDIHELEADTI